MTILINIEYRTEWGEILVFCYGKKKQPLGYAGNGIWSGRIEKFNPEKTPEYHFEVEKDGVCVRREWKGHFIHVPLDRMPKVLRLKDSWRDRPCDLPFWSSMFTDSVFGRRGKKNTDAAGGNLTIVTSCPAVRPDETLAVAGSTPELGCWSAMLPMDDSRFPEWSVEIPACAGGEYKFVIVSRDTLQPVIWEEGGNRFFAGNVQAGEKVVEEVRQPSFQRPSWKGAGTAIPVFSLRSCRSFGIGEFNDLNLLVDWAARTGQRIIQILPVNDTTMTGTWEDSYPYNANSSFALHPQFLNLPAAGLVEDEDYCGLRDELNALPEVDYERVNSEKLRLLRILYRKKGTRTLKSARYVKFAEENLGWLVPYAVFCCLRDEFGTVDFSKWKGFSRGTAKKVSDYAESHPAEVGFWCFVQYNLHLQLSDACAYAHSKGIVLKGDLPIGVSRTSADAWMHPELFHMDSQAGAPPDAFSANGQNWGFPTYNWEVMAEDGFAWWKARLRKMSGYFDAFRIDHILGFFRIWEIPLGEKSGLYGHFNPALPYSAEEIGYRGLPLEGLFLEDPRRKGMYHPFIGAMDSQEYGNLDDGRKKAYGEMYFDFFYRRHNAFWKDSAMSKLPPLLDSTRMLACGEDLGMIPDCVPETMSELKILSLEIQRMPKLQGEAFADPYKYPYHCVCTTSTHDMNPLRAWWKEDSGVTERFWHEVLHEGGPVPSDCEPWICRKIIGQHLASPAMLTILPLQDWLSIDGRLRSADPDKERINVPAIPRYYWRYRMHLSLEDLLREDGFNDEVAGMVKAAGRE